ncbi:MAG TPA: RidA family protein [Rhizomicrobium sp.]|nr:RidA family protein [Rhizomicrobium sp.]
MSRVEYVTRPHMKPLIEPYGLSEAVRHGALLTVAGQTGMNREHQIVAGGLKAQALQAFRNIAEIIACADGDPANLVHLTWYLAPSNRSFMEDAIDVTAARMEVFPGIAPGSTAVRVKELLTSDILVEIQAVCAL